MGEGGFYPVQLGLYNLVHAFVFCSFGVCCTEYQGVGCYYLGSCSLIEARGKGRMFGLVPAKLFLKKETGVQPFAVWREAFFGSRLEGFWKRLVPASNLQSLVSSSPLLF